MRMCGYVDVAMDKMRRKMRILPEHAPPVTGILKSLTLYGVAIRLRSFNGEFMHL